MQDDIDYIMNSFDFQRVLKVMQVLEWKWIDAVPNLEEIKAQAERLLKSISETNLSAGSIWCGGFKASKRSGHSESFLDLEFILEDCCSLYNNIRRQQVVEASTFVLKAEND